MIVKVTALCIAVAMISATLRVQKPELAMAVSLAGGLVTLALLSTELSGAQRWLDGFKGLMNGDGDVALLILKGAGIAIVSELGAQLCIDAGEKALAGRITLAARVATLGLCGPMILEITSLIRDVLS